MKVLITGATGYVGKHLVKELCQQDDDLFALVRESSNTDELFKLGVNIIKGDISDKESFSRITDNFDIVIHLAYSLFPKSDPQINETGFDNIVNHFKNAPLKRFIYVSSALVYGNTSKHDEVNESHSCKPNMYFAKQQLRAENILLALNTSKKFPCVILRPSEIYGGKGGYFKNVQLDGYIKGSVPIIGNGENAISMTYIGDLVQAIKSSMSKNEIEGSIFNINTPGLLTINELSKLIKTSVRTNTIIRVPVFMGWIIASLVIIISRILRKTPFMDYDIMRVATMESGVRSIYKAINSLDFKPRYNNISEGLSDCYFKQLDKDASITL